MTRMLVNTKIRFQKAIEEREAGQGTLEYVGIVIIAALLVTALIAAFDAFDLRTTVSGYLTEIQNAGG